MKLLSVLSLSLVLSCTTLSAQKVYEISAFGLKANSNKNAPRFFKSACQDKGGIGKVRR